jgi:hypothetical protein
MVTFKDSCGIEHQFSHFWIKNLSDGSAIAPEDIVKAMEEIDKMFIKVLVINCNGGLGRAAFVASCRELWDIARDSIEHGIKLTYNQDNMGSAIDGRLNLAAVLRNILLHGTYARSTFVHTQEQFEGLYKFAIYLVNNQETLGALFATSNRTHSATSPISSGSSLPSLSSDTSSSSLSSSSGDLLDSFPLPSSSSSSSNFGKFSESLVLDDAHSAPSSLVCEDRH